MNTQSTSESRTADWIRIAQAEIPPRKLRPLLEAYEYNPTELLRGPASRWAQIIPGFLDKQASRLEANARASVDEALAALDRMGGWILSIDDSSYPSNLREIGDASPVLFVRGSLCADDRFSIAIVGSRRATMYGMSIAERFAKLLAARGLCIVSGGARGIDSRAHRGALSGGGRTIVFLGCGLDIVYPSENRQLFDEIVAGGKGAILSEFAPGVTPEPWRFPARNRLISGMTMGTLVIETPVDSGAMITASDAAAQGRDVFAVPGPIETGRNAGCHRLIREGAKLVETADDIVEELGLMRLDMDSSLSMTLSGYQPPPPDLDDDQRMILDRLTLQPQAVDHLICAGELNTPQVMAVLTLLEMRGLARRVPGNAFVRVL